MPQVVGVCCWVEKTKVSGGGDFFGWHLEWKSRCKPRHELQSIRKRFFKKAASLVPQAREKSA